MPNKTIKIANKEITLCGDKEDFEKLEWIKQIEKDNIQVNRQLQILFCKNWLYANPN